MVSTSPGRNISAQTPSPQRAFVAGKRLALSIAAGLIVSWVALVAKTYAEFTPGSEWSDLRIPYSEFIDERLEPELCYDSFQRFWGCIEALDAVGMYSSPAFSVLTPIETENLSKLRTSVLKTWGSTPSTALTLVRRIDRSLTIDGDFVTAAELSAVQAHRQVRIMAVSTLQLRTLENRLDFKRLFRELPYFNNYSIQSSLAGSAAYSAFIQTYRNPHDRLEPTAARKKNESIHSVQIPTWSPPPVLRGEDAKDSSPQPTVNFVNIDRIQTKSIVHQPYHWVYASISTFQMSDLCQLLTEKLDSVFRSGILHYGVILDLRGNRGGLLSQATCLISLFQKDSRIRRFNLESRQYSESLGNRNGTPRYSLPLVVLIDGGSMSASEIVSLALQESSRAWIVGERSFGKGISQTFYEDDLGFTEYVTEHRLETVGNHSPQITGVVPDFSVLTPRIPGSIRVREENRYPNPLFETTEPSPPKRVTEARRLRRCVEERLTGPRASEDDHILTYASHLLACMMQN